MTPVEERIDHEARFERWRDAFERAFGHVPLSLYDEDRKPAERAFGEMVVLLTEHSARDYALAEVVFLLDPATGSPRPTEALRVARRALPATEPAQPEEEPS